MRAPSLAASASAARDPLIIFTIQSNTCEYTCFANASRAYPACSADSGVSTTSLPARHENTDDDQNHKYADHDLYFGGLESLHMKRA